MPTREQVNKLVVAQELERRGELPPEYEPIMAELRSRGIIPPISAGPVPESGFGAFMAGVGKGVTDVGRGLKQAAFAGSELPYAQELQAEIDESRRLDQPLLESAPGLAGNITGAVTSALPTALIPGAGTYAGAASVGAGLGALQPVAEGESRAANTLLGGAGGVVGRGIVGGISSLLAPKTSPAVSEMLEQGVPLTPGQIGGGMLAGLENKATAIPVVGDMIIGAQKAAREAFNKTALNRVLAPIGKTSSMVGREGISEADDYIRAAYSDAVKGLTATADDQFVTEVKAVADLAKTLPPERFEQVKRILQTQVASKFTGAGSVSGETFKQIDSELGRLARLYLPSAVGDERQVGEAMRATQRALRDLIARANPDKAQAIRNADEAFANFLRVESAAAGAGAPGGVFTPAQLKAAARRLEPGARKRQFSKGEALMQDLAEAGQEAMPTFPTSGTTERAIVGAGALGLGTVEPMTALGLGGVGAMYTPQMQALARAMMTQRPQISRSVGGLIRRQAPRSGAVGAGLLPGLYENP